MNSLVFLWYRAESPPGSAIDAGQSGSPDLNQTNKSFRYRFYYLAIKRGKGGGAVGTKA